jgi:hypothetical protein
MKALEQFFSPDITFTYNSDFWGYLMVPVTELGQAFVKRVKGLRTSKGFLVSTIQIEDCYDSALRCGLTCERTDKD